MTAPHALIIDDNAENIGVLGEMLSLEGVTFTKVSHTSRLGDALKTLRQLDIVFLDLEMPGENGFQILQTFKQNPAYNNVPVVAYTVHVSEINKARTSGFDSFLAKPLDADRFPDQLARILRGESVWAASY